MYEGIGSLVCSILLLIAPVSNVLIRLCCQGRGTRDFIAGSDFLNLESMILKAILLPLTHSYSDELVLRRCNILLHTLMQRLCIKL